MISQDTLATRDFNEYVREQPAIAIISIAINLQAHNVKATVFCASRTTTVVCLSLSEKNTIPTAAQQ